MRSRRQLRKVHIDQQEWQWYLKDDETAIVVFSPRGERVEISTDELPKKTYLTKVTPGRVKEYIETVILGRTSLETPMTSEPVDDELLSEKMSKGIQEAINENPPPLSNN